MKKSMTLLVLMILVAGMMPLAFAAKPTLISANGQKHQICPAVCVEMWKLSGGECEFTNCGSGCGADGVSTFATEEECLANVMNEHCYNDIMDEDEEGIDCGGSCRACTLSGKVVRINKGVRAAKAAQVLHSNVEKFMEFHTNKLEGVLAACDEKADYAEKCKAIIQARIEKFNEMPKPLVTALQKVEQKRFELKTAVENLQATPCFQKYKEAGFKARNLAGTVVAENAQKFNSLQNTFNNRLKNMHSFKNNFQSAKEILQTCKDDAESGECMQARINVHTHAIEFLENSVNLIKDQLDKLKLKIESSEDITEEEEQEILAKIDELLSEADVLLGKISVLDSDSTKEEIDEVRKSVLDFWKDAHPLLKRNIQSLVHSRIGGVILQTKQLEVKLQNILSRMTELGYDTLDYEDYVEEFESYVESAKGYFEQAREKLADAKEALGEDKEVQIEEAHELIESAKQELENARLVLRSIVEELHEQNAEALLDEDEVNDLLDELEEEILEE